MNKISYLVATILITTCFYGCATIMNGPSQDVGFASCPSGAKVTVDGDSLGITPLTVSLARKDTHLVKIEADGYKPYEMPILKKTSGWVWGNLMFSVYGLAGLWLDFQSGGIYRLTPKRLQVSLPDGDIIQKFDRKMWNMPPLNAGRIAGELVAGGVGGALGFFGPIYIVMHVFKGIGWVPEDVGAILLLACLPVGSSLGVYLVGNLGNETGSLRSTIKGSVLGWAGANALAGAILLINEEQPNVARASIAKFILFAGPSIGATIGFNMTSRYKTPPAETETGLINFREGQMSFTVPTAYLRPNPFIRGDLVQTIDLVSVRF